MDTFETSMDKCTTIEVQGLVDPFTFRFLFLNFTVTILISPSLLLQVESRVVDECLRDMVRMLDSKNELQASEAVVALRTLLQQTAGRNDDSDKKNDPESPQDTTESLVKAGLQNKAAGGKEKVGLRNTKFWLQVVSQLIQSLEDLTSPVARASVIWIIGEYRNQVPSHSPDAVRSLAKSFKNESPEVKSQALSLAYKIWASHYLKDESRKSKESGSAGVAGEGGSTDASPKSVKSGKSEGCMGVEDGPGDVKRRCLVKSEDEFAVRLGQILEYMCRQSLADEDWDLRDLGRLYLKLKRDAEAWKMSGGSNNPASKLDFAAVYTGLFAKVPTSSELEHTLEEITNLRRKKQGETQRSSQGSQTPQGPGKMGGRFSTGADGDQPSHCSLPYKDKNSWILYSLARLLDGSFQSYHALPSKALVEPLQNGKIDDTPRDPPTESVQMIERREMPQSFSSDRPQIGGLQRATVPSMIEKSAVPEIKTLDDLDSFYATTEKTVVSIK